MQAMYTSPTVKRVRVPAEQVVEQLYAALVADPRELPPRWQERIEEVAGEGPWKGRIIGDYVAGMTDRFAIREHRRLTGTSPMPDESYF
jgi:dGTPase